MDKTVLVQSNEELFEKIKEKIVDSLAAGKTSRCDFYLLLSFKNDISNEDKKIAEYIDNLLNELNIFHHKYSVHSLNNQINDDASLLYITLGFVKYKDVFYKNLNLYIINNNVDEWIKLRKDLNDIKNCKRYINELYPLNNNIRNISKEIIDRIEIRYLFGLYRYDIDLSKNVFAIHSPNGCGKSTILDLISSFYVKRKNSIPYEQIEFTLNDNKKYIYYSQEKFGKNRNNIMPDVNVTKFSNIKNIDFETGDFYFFEKEKEKYEIIIDKNLVNKINSFDSILYDFFNYEKIININRMKLIKYIELNDLSDIENGSEDIFDYFSKILDDVLTIKYNLDPKKEIKGALKKGELLKLKDLSTGERYIIYLIFKLMFCTKKGELILLDEPEVCLHIEWQELLMKYIVQFSNEYNFKVLIASHSPYIVGYPGIASGYVMEEED